MPEDLLLCPVRALSAYLDRTSGIVNRPRVLFVSSTCPSRAMSKNGISYMLREVIVQSGASSRCGQVPRAHSISGVATASAFFHNWSLRSVLEAAAWRSTTGYFFFFAGFYPFLQMEFILWVHLLLLVNALGNSHFYLTCSGGGGGVILVCFSQQLA